MPSDNFMGNNKIGLTAEFVSIMKSEDDKKYSYFVSPKAKKIYGLAEKLIPEKKLKQIFDWRMKLSQIFDEKVLMTESEQIIEFGCGYSLRGFNLCLSNKNIIYIDTDLNSVVLQKRKVLENICKEEQIDFPENYYLVDIDVLNDDIFKKVANFISLNKEILAIAEGLTSYFSEREFREFFKKIKFFLDKFTSYEFFSNEIISRPKGIFYRILRLLIAFLTRTLGSRKLKTTEELGKFLDDIGIFDYNIKISELGIILYSIKK